MPRYSNSLLTLLLCVATATVVSAQRRETAASPAPPCSAVKAESRFEASLAAPFEAPATLADWKAKQAGGPVEDTPGKEAGVTEATFRCTDDTGDFVESAMFRTDGSKYFVARFYPKLQPKVPDPVLTWLLGNNHRVQVTGADRLEISLGAREGATETLTIRISTGAIYVREKSRAIFPR